MARCVRRAAMGEETKQRLTLCSPLLHPYPVGDVGLVVSSAVVGYAMAPGDMVMSLDNALCFNGMMIGTALCVFSANSFNQWLEVPFDAQMKRTCNRPLVRGAIRPVHALGMACAFGVTGTATLLAFTNPLTALLGFGNIALYAGVYTSMKRTSIANTVRWLCACLALPHVAPPVGAL